MLIPIALLIDRPWTLPPPGLATVLAIVAIASLSTALAYILYFRILAGAWGDECGAGDAARARHLDPARGDVPA
jgi:hypothetical protein